MVNHEEMLKCLDLQKAIQTRIEQSETTPFNHPSYMGLEWPDFPPFLCIEGRTQFDCMEHISKGNADLMQLETALSYTAGQYFTMMPLMAEKYQNGW